MIDTNAIMSSWWKSIGRTLLVVALLSDLLLIPCAPVVTADAATFSMDLIGEYDGSSGWVTVRRNIEMHLSSIDESGTVRGTATISPSNKANSHYGANGSYHIRGSFDRSTGDISLRGYQWIDYPVGDDESLGWSFASFEGTYNKLTGEIDGRSDRGIWEMSSINYSKRSGHSRFKLASDNNSFAHTDSNASPQAGFVGVDDYSLSPAFFDALVSGCDSGEIASIKHHAADKWGGSCYGIAATMGLAYEGRLSTKKLSHSNVTDYYELPLPYEDSTLLDTINYYQLSQSLSHGGKDSAMVSSVYGKSAFGKIANWLVDDDSLSVFLKTLVNRASNGHTSLLGYSYSGKGHAVLVTGCSYDRTKERFDVSVYDENSVDSSLVTGKFNHLYVKKDYSGFRYTSVDSKTIRASQFNDKFDQLYLLDWEKMIDSPFSRLGSKRLPQEQNVSGNDHLTFAKGKAARVENSNDECLRYDGKSFSGDMTIYGVNVEEDGATVNYVFEVPPSEDYMVSETGKSTSVSVRNPGTYLDLSGKGIDRARLSYEDGITAWGKACSFDAAISTPAKNVGSEPGLVSFAGKAKSGVSITRKRAFATICSDSPLSKLTVTTYKRDAVAKTKTKEGRTTATVDANRKVIGSASIRLSKKTYSYNGKKRKPKMTTRVGDKKLKQGKHYRIVYKNNIKAGIARAAAIGIGNWHGSKTLRFRIAPKGTLVTHVKGARKSARVRWRRQAVQTSGYQIRFSRSKNMKRAKTKSVAASRRTSCKLEGLSRGELYVQIRTYKKSKSGYSFSTWSKKKEAIVK